MWNFHIGGYQVCEKWLKDRQAKGGKNPRPGRVLTDEDIDHYQKIVVALGETIRIMAQIDEVIDAHGGWPDAFVTGPITAGPITAGPITAGADYRGRVTAGRASPTRWKSRFGPTRYLPRDGVTSRGA